MRKAFFYAVLILLAFYIGDWLGYNPPYQDTYPEMQVEQDSPKHYKPDSLPKVYNKIYPNYPGDIHDINSMDHDPQNDSYDPEESDKYRD